MISHYFIDDNLSQAWSINSSLNGFVINHFYELVDNDKDGPIAVTLLVRQYWQFSDKIN